MRKSLKNLLTKIFNLFKNNQYSIKISRNAPCPCGSGKKYKRCCFPKYDKRKIFHKKNLDDPLEHSKGY